MQHRRHRYWELRTKPHRASPAKYRTELHHSHYTHSRNKRNLNSCACWAISKIYEYFIFPWLCSVSLLTGISFTKLIMMLHKTLIGIFTHEEIHQCEMVETIISRSPPIPGWRHQTDKTSRLFGAQFESSPRTWQPLSTATPVAWCKDDMGSYLGLREDFLLCL